MITLTWGNAMPSLQIRDLPDDVYRALAERARRQGRSLAQQALFELRRLAGVEAEEQRRATLAALRDRKWPESLTDLPDPVDLVREDRDA
jgi:plasmid stability protein